MLARRTPRSGRRGFGLGSGVFGRAVCQAVLTCGVALAAQAEAPDPAADRLKHWAFQPLTHPGVPPVTHSDWPRNELDPFILARLEQEGLSPSPAADRRTSIRRLCFDLTGLPPAPEAVQAFVAEGSPDAYERLVDRLLASPPHGERWARHWLDVVHFGESHGYDKDKPRPNAWPYRDYVIRSLNADKPYSRFVQEQVAGDTLFPDDPDGTVALGFLSAGPWDFVGHVELPESKTDGLIARYNDRDDMVMTTMSTFLSLTVHCARCHDHKFDPISSREYYALQAVFAGVDRADRTFDADPALHARRQALLATQRGLARRQRELDRLVEGTTNAAITEAKAALKMASAELAALPRSQESPANGYHSALEPKADVTKWVQVDLASVVGFDEVRLIPARPTDFADTPGFGFPPRYRIEASEDDTFSRPVLLADHTVADVGNPGDQAVVIKVPEGRARYVRITATRLWERTQDYVFALAELEVRRGTNNLAWNAPVQALDSIESGRWGRSRLTDGYDSRQRLEGAAEPAEQASRRRALQERVAQLTREHEAAVEQALEPEVRRERKQVAEQLTGLKDQLAALPKPELIYAATADFAPSGNFHPSDWPRTVHYLKRGSVKTPDDEMAPATLRCLAGLPADLAVDEPGNEARRRAALARWLTDSRNALLRRSVVNRVWQYHFGRGLVDTPNDFGHLGSPPSHPELLDWLAGWFQDHGESLKALHRLILTSATWRQSSEVRNVEFGMRNEADSGTGIPHSALRTPHSLDSDNRLLWRMNRGRLDAESLRDAMLSASGTLDLTMGGPSAQQFWFKDDHSPTYDYARFDPDSPGAFRRSVYRFVVRSVPDPFMDTMDCPDPSVLTPKRNTTLTPLQALSLLNNPFVLKQAEHLAERVGRECVSTEDRVARMYALVLGRAPDPEEARALAGYAEKHGLAAAGRLLWNSNEFVFLD